MAASNRTANISISGKFLRMLKCGCRNAGPARHGQHRGKQSHSAALSGVLALSLYFSQYKVKNVVMKSRKIERSFLVKGRGVVLRLNFWLLREHQANGGTPTPPSHNRRAPPIKLVP